MSLPPKEAYTFQITAKDTGSPPLATPTPATVTINFIDEDLHPPDFNNYVFTEQITTVEQTEIDYIFDLRIKAEDASGVEYMILEEPSVCQGCFELSDAADGSKSIKLTKKLSQDVLKTGMMSLVVQAKEGPSGVGRTSIALVNIPIQGDLYSPQFDTDFYTESLENVENEVFTPHDDDVLIPSDTFHFSLASDAPKFDDCLAVTETGTTAKITKKTGALECLQKIDPIGPIVFFIQVADLVDPNKNGRSLVTLNYPSGTTAAPTDTTTPKGGQETTTTDCVCPPTVTPTDCPITTTDCPIITTVCPDVPPYGKDITITSGDHNSFDQ